MITAGKTVIVVSHSPPLIEEIATRVALLDKGVLRRVGQAKSEILGSYLEAKGSLAS